MFLHCTSRPCIPFRCLLTPGPADHGLRTLEPSMTTLIARSTSHQRGNCDPILSVFVHCTGQLCIFLRCQRRRYPADGGVQRLPPFMVLHYICVRDGTSAATTDQLLLVSRLYTVLDSCPSSSTVLLPLIQSIVGSKH